MGLRRLLKPYFRGEAGIHQLIVTLKDSTELTTELVVDGNGCFSISEAEFPEIVHFSEMVLDPSYDRNEKWWAAKTAEQPLH